MIWMKLVHNNPVHEAPLGFCLRVIENEFHPNLKKTKSSVLSVISTNLCVKQTTAALILHCKLAYIQVLLEGSSIS